MGSTIYLSGPFAFTIRFNMIMLSAGLELETFKLAVYHNNH